MQRTISKGFTLIELAVALTIVALVIGGLAVPMSKRIAEQQYIDTQVSIDKAIDSLVGYAILNRRLPCPDVSTANADNRDGFEDIAGSLGAITGCSIGITGTASNVANYHSDPDGVSWGDLPWQTLGLAAPNNVDAWNNRLRYAVFTPLVTQVAPSVTCSNTVNPPTIGIGFQNLGCNTAIANTTIAGGGQIDIRCGNPSTTTSSTAAPGCLSTPAVAPYQVTQSAVFVVYSMGANGYGATSIVNLASQTSNAFTVIASGTTTRQTKYPDEAANAPELDSGTSQALASALRRQFVVRARTDETSQSGAYDDIVSFMSASTLAAKLSNAGVWP